MELGDLPYDCLSCIFDFIPDLKLLLNLSTVCKQWNILVKRRLKKIRHLHVESKSDLSYAPFSSDNHIYTDDIGYLERVNVSQLLPNLKYFSKSSYLTGKCTCKMLLNVLSSTSNPLIGLHSEVPCDFGSGCHVSLDEIVKHCGSLEYLYSLHEPFRDSYFFKYKFGQKLKYFDGHFEGYFDLESDEEEEEDIDYDSRFEEISLLCRYFKQMPNLEVLSLDKPLIEPRLWPLPKMKLKEIQLRDIRSSSSVSQFLPFFPDLRTIRLHIREVKDKGSPDSHIHLNVQNFFLNIHEPQSSHVESLNLVKTVMAKLPNCTNLCILLLQGVITITNGDLIEIIKVLPNLTLFVLDVENWEDANIIETLDKFCKSVGRRINFILRGTAHHGTKGARSYTRYILNEDVSSPLKIDYEFLQMCHVY
ncbi:uncharacterized protein LOC128387197 [Panonychus citri]|uniref:uncharacterized protein LOC128387197 n=1 Tax=Panonychus citri TaxID=50023 RepID=UPI0023079E2C|nr:uncharacterized protein LOC128387197 [Panonychus citri]